MRARLPNLEKLRTPLWSASPRNSSYQFEDNILDYLGKIYNTQKVHSFKQKRDIQVTPCILRLK